VNPFALGPRAIAEFYTARNLRVLVEGRERVPRRGAALLAARHYHHLYDGSAILHGLARQPYLFVALDWTRGSFERLVMETVCNLAEWPIALRGESLAHEPMTSTGRREARRYARASLERAAALLRRGELLLVFPEGYPTIDPSGSRKTSDDAFLPFRPGFAAIVARAERLGSVRVPILPIGLSYDARARRTNVTVRVGEPVYRDEFASRDALVATVERSVRALSA